MRGRQCSRWKKKKQHFWINSLTGTCTAMSPCNVTMLCHGFWSLSFIDPYWWVCFRSIATLNDTVVYLCVDHSDGAETMYYFTALALTLNETEEGVSPTDSRRRPDQRLMEDGRWDEANAEKQRLEEKQRSVRREREREAASQRTSSQSEEGRSTVCWWIRVSRACDFFLILF